MLAVGSHASNAPFNDPHTGAIMPGASRTATRIWGRLEPSLGGERAGFGVEKPSNGGEGQESVSTGREHHRCPGGELLEVLVKFWAPRFHDSENVCALYRM